MRFSDNVKDLAGYLAALIEIKGIVVNGDKNLSLFLITVGLEVPMAHLAILGCFELIWQF